MKNGLLYICPVCKQKLEVQADLSAKCQNGHSFDRAKEGYYHLLLPAKGGIHGDDRMMVEARRSFLSLGYYEKLADRVTELAAAYTPAGGVLLDAGCGEGYYTDRMEHALEEKGCRTLGFDISKDAVRRAAKRNGAIELAVAGSYHIPLPDGSVDTVVDMFSPLSREEFLRVLKPGGTLLMAIPGREHLFALKAAVYDTPYPNEVKDTALDGFDLLSDDSLTYEMTLASPEAVRSLFYMTPYAYRTGAEGRARVDALTSLNVNADFRIFAYRKK